MDMNDTLARKYHNNKQLVLNIGYSCCVKCVVVVTDIKTLNVSLHNIALMYEPGGGGDFSKLSAGGSIM